MPPFYTGKQKLVDTAGRIEQFKRNMIKNPKSIMIKTILISIMKPTILVGGQAVIEGVMMRVPGAYATAVRDPNGKIHVENKKSFVIGERSAFWRKPILGAWQDYMNQ